MGMQQYNIMEIQNHSNAYITMQKCIFQNHEQINQTCFIEKHLGILFITKDYPDIL